MTISTSFKVCIFLLIFIISAGVYFILYNFAKMQCNASDYDSTTNEDSADGCSTQVYAMLALVCACPSFMFAVCMIVSGDEKKLYRDLMKHFPAHESEKKPLLIAYSIHD